MKLFGKTLALPSDKKLAELVAALDANSREYFEERAGILEYDCGHPRAKAERWAWEDTQKYLLSRGNE